MLFECHMILRVAVSLVTLTKIRTIKLRVRLLGNPAKSIVPNCVH